MINIVHCKIISKHEYVGRPSVLGNPFPMRTEADRHEVIAKYEVWLKDKIKKKDEKVIAELKRLKQIAINGNLNLGCWCAPKKCHADVIKNIIEKSIKQMEVK